MRRSKSGAGKSPVGGTDWRSLNNRHIACDKETPHGARGRAGDSPQRKTHDDPKITSTAQE